jgi:hypothetical protein
MPGRNRLSGEFAQHYYDKLVVPMVNAEGIFGRALANYISVAGEKLGIARRAVNANVGNETLSGIENAFSHAARSAGEVAAALMPAPSCPVPLLPVHRPIRPRDLERGSRRWRPKMS